MSSSFVYEQGLVNNEASLPYNFTQFLLPIFASEKSVDLVEGAALMPGGAAGCLPRAWSELLFSSLVSPENNLSRPSFLAYQRSGNRLKVRYVVRELWCEKCC